MTRDKIVVNVLINKPIDEVWRSWADQDAIRIWSVPFDDWHCPVVRMDLKSGGSFYVRMETIDGREGLDCVGTYDQVVAARLVEMRLSDGRSVTIEFQHIDQNTIVRESFDPADEPLPEVQKECCQSVLNRFKDYAESN